MSIPALIPNTPYSLALKIVSYSLLLISISFGLKAQERCGTVAYQKMLNPDHSIQETRFENWMKNQQVKPMLKSFSTEGTSAATYVIPVVVHVIHNGEPIGTGTNISDAQIISQINVLNKDYQRLNADANQTPSVFLPVAGSLDIEFVLAKQDPEGLDTNGITRTQGSRTSWTLAQNTEFKSLSYWPAEDYMNIWVINFDDPQNFIGYAQFPESNLPGLENSSSDPLTDGIVLNYRDIGSIDDGPFDLETQYNKGRTATHEIGHFFGLRHLWGDGSSCGPPGDYVDDTPEQSSSTNGCPAHPQTSCSNAKMFQNYLDYTNDACMNLFTTGQIGRMEIVLQNSPRRASLTTSLGSQEPLPASNDLGLREILNPGITSCGGMVTPYIEVRNYGTNTITSARIEFKVNGVVTETKDATLNLDNLAIATIPFNPINLSSPSSTIVSFEILQTNGTADGKVSDNLISHTTLVPVVTTLPLFEMFDATPADWIIQNPDQLITWQNVSAINGEAGNRSMFLNYDAYEETGTEDQLLTPVLNLNGSTAALLRFDRAYAQFPGSSFNDVLKVIVVENCNSDLSQGVEIFNKSGADLATAPSTSNSFFPNGPSQWLTESIALSQFIGSGNIQIAFIGKNGYGNNLFLDNAYIFSGDLTDVLLADIVSPSPVVNKNEITPIIKMMNVGSLPINQVKVETKVNGAIVSTKLISALSFTTGQELNMTLDPISLNNGSNTIMFTLLEPNGVADEAPSNNALSRTVIVNNSTESIPARQNFNISFQDSWTILSQQSMPDWEITTTNQGNSLVYRAFSNTSIGDEAWLVSPVLDFSKSVKASLFFDLSYASSTKGNDRLQVLSSINGGESFAQAQFDQTGNQFSSAISSAEWIPTTELDWKRQYINLNDLVGEPNVRLAFVATNDNGNNIYLDDIELFNDDDPFPPKTASLYSIYMLTPDEIKVTFNLAEKETSRLQVYNMLGQIMIDNQLPDNLNQTYTIDMSNHQQGIYIVRLQVVNQIETTKVFINH